MRSAESELGNMTQPRPKGTVLVVDDDDAVRSGLYWALTSDYQVLQAASRDQAGALINENEIDVVVSDLHLPPHIDDITEGLALIDIARAQDPPQQVVVITGSDSKRACSVRSPPPRKPASVSGSTLVAK